MVLEAVLSDAGLHASIGKKSPCGASFAGAVALDLGQSGKPRKTAPIPSFCKRNRGRLTFANEPKSQIIHLGVLGENL
jgi:hypothetical protein